MSLDVRAGEIVGIAGVSGNGQRELLAAISGRDAFGQMTRFASVDPLLDRGILRKRAHQAKHVPKNDSVAALLTASCPTTLC